MGKGTETKSKLQMKREWNEMGYHELVVEVTEEAMILVINLFNQEENEEEPVRWVV